MKKFILRTLIFIGIFVIAFFSFLLISASYLRKNARFKIQADTKTVVFGDSHPECAFNDSLINNFKNFAQSGESYFYVYPKLKRIVKQNPGLETVFIDFSNNQISENRDTWIWNDEYISNRLPAYLPFMDSYDLKVLFVKNYSGFINSLSLYLKENFKRLARRDLNYADNIGGYRYLLRNKTDSLLKHPPVLAPFAIRDYKMPAYNLLYLEKILSFCKENKKQAFLVRSPLHPRFHELANEQLFAETLKTKFGDVEFLDFKNFPADNSEFGDLEHLNFRGAAKFSTWLNDLISQGLLKKPGKQQFIDQKIRDKTVSDTKMISEGNQTSFFLVE